MRKAQIILTLFSGLFLFACATPQDMAGINQKLQELTKAVGAVQINQAEISSRMDDLQRDVTAATENVKDFNDQMSQFSSRIDDIKVLNNLAEENQKALLPSQIFEEARLNTDKGNIDAGKEGFDLYLKNFPNGEYVEASRNYLGDIAYAKKNYQDAAVAYALLLKDYPKSKSTASYRLKYARSIILLKKTDEAKQYLQSIIQDFPSSQEAKRAREVLATLK